MKNSNMVRRAVLIRGQATGISLEPEFHAALKKHAENSKASINAVVTAIDEARPARQNLSSAIRVHLFRLAKRGALLAILLPLLPGCGEALPPPAAHVRVIDGDTLQVNETRIRLMHIDAVEYNQRCRDRDNKDWPCGAVATMKMKAFVADREVYCGAPQGKDRYGRTLAVCAAKGVGDLGAAMVREGYAMASGNAYGLLEMEAARAGKGIWSGTFQRPADHRREK